MLPHRGAHGGRRHAQQAWLCASAGSAGDGLWHSSLATRGCGGTRPFLSPVSRVAAVPGVDPPALGRAARCSLFLVECYLFRRDKVATAATFVRFFMACWAALTVTGFMTEVGKLKRGVVLVGGELSCSGISGK